MNTQIKPDQNMLLMTIILLAQIKSPFCENNQQNYTRKEPEEKPCKAREKKICLECMTRGIPQYTYNQLL